MRYLILVLNPIGNPPCRTIVNNENNTESNQTCSKTQNEKLFGIDKIAWPFFISGAWIMVFSLGYAILGNSLIYKICRKM